MMNKILSFNEGKVKRSQDSRDWTTLDALKSLVRDIELGNIRPVQIAVHFWELIDHDDFEGGKTHGYTIAGLTYPEHIALLNVALRNSLNEWVGSPDSEE